MAHGKGDDKALVVAPKVQADPVAEDEDSEVPITLISGFNGAGKTFVLRHLLRHKCTDADEISPEELRVGVICATNTDAKLLRRKEKEVIGKDVLRSTHSCPCCVEEKLSKDLASLIQQGEEDDHESPIDRVLVECGWASPRTLRNRLQEAKEQGIEDAQKFVVDSMVSVIDASKVQELWETTDILVDRPELDGFAESNLNGPPVAGAENYAKRRVSELLAEQIECADVVVLTKMELVPPEQRDFVRALLRLLLPPNPGSIVVPVESGADPSPHLAERVWIDSDWERTVATNTNEDDYKDCVARARELPATREELLWWPPAALSEATASIDRALDIESCKEGLEVRVLRDETACRAAVKACDGLEEGSWEFDLMDQRLGAPGKITEVEQEDAIVEVNFGRWDERVRLSTFVYVQRKPFHSTRLEAVVKQLPTCLGCPCEEVEEAQAHEQEEVHAQTCFDAVVRSKGFVWLATFHTAALYWDHSGGHFSLINIGQWWAATDGGMEGHSDEFEGEFGDRRQELVFIGVDLDEEAIAKSLDACLLDDKELSYYRQHFMNPMADKAGPPGPLPGMPSGVPARVPDDREPQNRGSTAPASGSGTPAKPHGSEDTGHKKITPEKASAKSRHEEGNTAFRREDYKLAVKLYSQAIGLCEVSNPRSSGNQRSRRVAGKGADSKEAKDLLERKATLLTNRAECYLRTHNFSKALADCEAALALGISNWSKQEKTASRMKIASEKLGAEKIEKTKLAEQRRVAQARENKDEVARARENEAKRQAKLEAESLAAEAKRIEDELARDQEAEEERERQRQARSQQRDTTQEKLNEAKALWDKAEAQMRNAARLQRQATDATAAVDRRQADMKKRESRIKEKEARVAEDEKKFKQKQKNAESRAKQLDAQEAKLARDRSEFQTEMHRRQQELDQREERLRVREQQMERQRAGAAKHDKDLQQQDRHQKDAERALKERKRRLDAMQEALDSRERELRDVEIQKEPADQPETHVNVSPGPSGRTGHTIGDGDTQSWPTSPPLGPSQTSKHSGGADSSMGTGVSRFFPAQMDDVGDGNSLKHSRLPETYCCPITRQLMRDPVVACDGHTYEQQAIENWLSQKHVSPMTGERMNDHTVVPNRLLQNQIAQFVANQQIEGASMDHHVSPNSSPLENGFNPTLGLTPGPGTVRPMALGTSLFGQGEGSNSSSDSTSGTMPGAGITPGGFGHSLGTSTGAEPAAASVAFGQEGFMGIDGLLGWQDDIGTNAADHDSGWSTSSAAALQALDADEVSGVTDGGAEEASENTKLHKDMQPTDTQQGASLASNADELDPLAIYVSNINWETTSARLREIFSKNFGPVTHVNLKENKVRRSPSYAFIVFESAESAQKAIGKSSMTVDNRQLKFEPRRLQQKQSHSHQMQSHQHSRLQASDSKSALVERMGGIRPLDPKIGSVNSKSTHAGVLLGTDMGSSIAGETASSSGSSVAGPEAEQQPEPQPNTGKPGTSTDGERPPLVVRPGCRLFVGLGGGATGDDQRLQLARLFSNYGSVADVEVGFMGCAFVTMTNEEDARAAKSGLHATTPPISGLARKQGLAVEVATHKGYETALKKAGKPIPPATAL